MNVKITYLYHSCFSLQVDKKVLLFDYPGRGVEKKAEDRFRKMLNGKDLYVFVSHAHGDHFSTDVAKFSSDAESTHFILSRDVPSHGLSVTLKDITEAQPDSSYSLQDIGVRTFESNDAGVAYLIKLNSLTVYFGGDLAKWNWPEWSEKKRKEHVKVFDETTDILKEKDIDIAFSNTDQRLKSWAGPVEFIEKVRPKYFVPMHTFGNVEWIDDLVRKGWDSKTEIFHYSESGDEIVWNF